jgi:probable HAF family extracellular repeat protein
MKGLRLSVVVALALLVAAPLSSIAQSTFIDVGTLGPYPFQSSYLLAVNNRGDAVGYSEVSGLDSNVAMLWRDGQLIDLGVLPGLMLSVATDINDRGQIVGWSSEYQYARPRAVLWQDGQVIDITPPGYEACRAYAINKRGDIVGTCHDLPVVWRDGTFSVLPGLAGGPGVGVASDVNDAGVIVGALGGSNRSTPVRWMDGTVTALGMPADALGGVAEAVNERGDIVGYVVRPQFYDPVIWQGGTAVPLAGGWGLVYGYARGINNRGEVALHAFAGSITTYGGHVWRHGQFLWLEPATSLNDISDRGVAVGRVTGDSSGFTSHGAIWPKALTRIPVSGEAR